MRPATGVGETPGTTSTSVYNGDGLRMSLTVDSGTPVTTDYNLQPGLTL